MFTYPGDSVPGYGPARDTREEAEQDRPWRSEESFGRRVGLQTRQVTEWEDAR